MPNMHKWKNGKTEEPRGLLCPDFLILPASKSTGILFHLLWLF